MLIELNRHVKYVCKACYAIWDKEINVFGMSGGKLSLRCLDPECRAECVRIEDTGKRYKLSMGCPICEETHMSFVKKAEFWKKPLVTYKCPVPNIEIFFAGEADAVEKASETVQTEETGEAYDELAFESEDDKMILLYDIIGNIEELMDINRVKCVCRTGHVKLNMLNESAVLRCTGCGRTRIIAPTSENLEMLLQAEEIVLKD